MPKVILHGAQIGTLVGEVVAATMAQHVRPERCLLSRHRRRRWLRNLLQVRGQLKSWSSVWLARTRSEQRRCNLIAGNWIARCIQRTAPRHPNYGTNSCPAEQNPILVNGPALGLRSIDPLPLRSVQPIRLPSSTKRIPKQIPVPTQANVVEFKALTSVFIGGNLERVRASNVAGWTYPVSVDS
jgi:hypothetical protein